jgi:hypothetical protein
MKTMSAREAKNGFGLMIRGGSGNLNRSVEWSFRL